MTKARTMTILHHWIHVANCIHDETTRIIKAFKWIIAFNIKSHQIPISTYPWNLLPLLPNTLVYICKFKNIKTINLKILIRNLNHRLILQPSIEPQAWPLRLYLSSTKSNFQLLLGTKAHSSLSLSLPPSLPLSLSRDREHKKLMAPKTLIIQDNISKLAQKQITELGFHGLT